MLSKIIFLKKLVLQICLFNSNQDLKYFPFLYKHLRFGSIF